MFTYLLFKLVYRLAQVLPRRWSYVIGVRLADIFYVLRKNLRKAAEANILHILSVANPKIVYKTPIYAKQVFRNFSKYLIDFFSFSKFNIRDMHKFITIKNMAYVHRSFAKGKGVVALTAHLGNWELSSMAMALLGFPINVVALNHENTKVNRLFVNQRAMGNINVIPVGTNNKRYIDVLRKNQLIGLVGDRLTSRSGMMIKFFNTLTDVPRGPVVLSLRTGAPILPAFMIRTPKDNYELIFEKPIYPEEFIQSNIQTAEKQFMGRIIPILEKYIAQYPSQWFIFHKVWN